MYSGVSAPSVSVGNGPSSLFRNNFPVQGDLFFQTDAVSGTLTCTWIFNGSAWVLWNPGFFLPNAQAASTATFAVSATGSSYIASTYSATGAQTINLPAAPTIGQVYQIVDEGGSALSNNITISGNGNNISNLGTSASTLVIALNGGHYQMRFNGTIWIVFG